VLTEVVESGIRAVLVVGLRMAVPELTRVIDADILANEASKPGTPPEGLQIPYPYMTFRFEEDGMKASLGTRILRAGADYAYEPSLNENFEEDVIENFPFPGETVITFEVYDDMKNWRRLRRVLNLTRNYLAVSSDETVDPVSGKIRGLLGTFIDPETGDPVSDQESTPDGAIRLKCAVTRMTRSVNNSTRFNSARGERRWSFQVSIEGSYEWAKRWPSHAKVVDWKQLTGPPPLEEPEVFNPVITEITDSVELVSPLPSQE